MKLNLFVIQITLTRKIIIIKNMKLSDLGWETINKTIILRALKSKLFFMSL